MGRALQMMQATVASELYIAFLHGRTMFGRNVLTRADIQDIVAGMTTRFEFLGSSGASGNFAVRVEADQDPSSVRTDFEHAFGCECVLMTALEVRAMLAEGLNSLEHGLVKHRGAYRFQNNGMTWEPGLVMSSPELPANLAEDDVFKAAAGQIEAVTVSQCRALVVLKRGMPWGDGILAPVRTALRRRGVIADRITSRAFGSVERVLTVAQSVPVAEAP